MGGECESPPYWSTDKGGDDPIPLPDAVCVSKPQIASCALHGGTQNPFTLQIDHNGMDGALVAFGVQSHASHKVGAGLRSLLNQGGADRGPGDGGEVHWSVVVN